MKKQKQLFPHYLHKLILCLCLFFVSGCFTAKEWRNKDTCFLLKDIVEIEEFKSLFYVKLDCKDTILIIDTNHFFSDCSFVTKYGCNVEVRNKLEKNRNQIVLLSCKQNPNDAELFFSRRAIYKTSTYPIYGYTLTLKVKQNRNKNKIKILSSGSF